MKFPAVRRVFVVTPHPVDKFYQLFLISEAPGEPVALPRLGLLPATQDVVVDLHGFSESCLHREGREAKLLDEELQQTVSYSVELVCRVDAFAKPNYASTPDNIFQRLEVLEAPSRLDGSNGNRVLSGPGDEGIDGLFLLGLRGCGHKEKNREHQCSEPSLSYDGYTLLYFVHHGYVNDA